MKKNIFSNFFKSYNVVLCLIVAFVFVAMGIFGVRGNTFAFVFKICLYVILGLISVLGFFKLKSDEITSIDFLRFTGLLGSVGALVVTTLSVGVDLGMIIPLGAIAVILLISSIIRLVNGASEVANSGLKMYTAVLARKYNPIVILIVGVLLGSIVSLVTVYFPNWVRVFNTAYAAYAKPIILVACVLVIAMSLDKHSEASVFDAVLAIGAIASVSYFFATVCKDNAPYYQFFIIAAAIVVITLLRGLFYQGPKLRESKSMTVKYYTETARKYEVLIPLAVGVLVVAFFAASNYASVEISKIIKSLLKINLDLSSLSVVGIILLMVAAVCPLVVQLIVKGVKSSEINAFDYMTMVSASVCAFAIPVYFHYYDIDGTKAAIFGNPLLLVALIVVLVAGIAAVVLHVLRVRNYAFACYKVAAKPVKEKTPEEIQQESQVREIGKIEDLINVEKQPKANRGVIKVTYVDDDLNIVEAPQQPEEVEEVVYVDEEGNVVEAPAEGEEVVEEVVYVDEEGNVIEQPAEEVTEEVVEEVVVVDEEGNVIEQPVEEVTEEVVEEVVVVDEEGNVVEEVTEEVVYVDEEGNVVEEVEEVVYVDEEGNVVEEIDEEDEEEEDDVEETEEVEEAPVEEHKEKDIVINEAQIVDENGETKKIKRKFNSKMMFASYEAKEFYNEIKNYLVMYRAKGRNSSRCETFRYKGLVAKVALGGKSIKVFLALDPQSLQGSKYHFKDCSNKKQYQDVPVMIKVRSQRGLKYFKELVDMMMAARGVKPKKNYQPTNYLSQLIPNGEAILGSFGLSTDYLYNSMNAIGIPSELPDDLIDYIPCIQLDPLAEEEVEAAVYLDTLCGNFNDGDEINIDILKSLHIVQKGNVIRIKARGTLDKKFTIYAEYFDEDALKMLMCTNCTAIRIVR